MENIELKEWVTYTNIYTEEDEDGIYICADRSDSQTDYLWDFWEGDIICDMKISSDWKWYSYKVKSPLFEKEYIKKEKKEQEFDEDTFQGKINPWVINRD